MTPPGTGDLAPGGEALTTRPILHVGAAQTLDLVVIEQLRGLRDLGWNVHVACHFDGWESRLAADGFVLHPIDLPHRASAAQAVGAASSLLGLIVSQRAALVHTHNAHHGVVGRLLARAAGVPAVHTWRYNPLDAARSPVARVAYGVTEALASRAGQMVLFQNEDDIQMALRYRIVPADSVRMIRNGIRIERYRQPATPPAQTRRRLGIAADAEVIACVARLQERKRQADLLQASAIVRRSRPRLHVLLVGSGPDEAQLRRQASDLGLAEAVTFAGHQRDVADILHASDVVCLPSRREGAPRALLEAMAARRPVVATDVAGTRAVVQHERTGLLVAFAEPPALAGALLRVLSSPALAASLGDAGALAVEEGGWREQDVTGRVARAYRTLLGARLGAAGAR